MHVHTCLQEMLLLEDERSSLEARDKLLLGVGCVCHLVGVPPLEVALAHNTLCTGVLHVQGTRSKCADRAMTEHAVLSVL